jgi:hypothetical protein
MEAVWLTLSPLQSDRIANGNHIHPSLLTQLCHFWNIASSISRTILVHSEFQHNNQNVLC